MARSVTELRELAELTEIATRMEGTYGAGKYCKSEGDCQDIGQINGVPPGMTFEVRGPFRR